LKHRESVQIFRSSLSNSHLINKVCSSLTKSYSIIIEKFSTVFATLSLPAPIKSLPLFTANYYILDSICSCYCRILTILISRLLQLKAKISWIGIETFRNLSNSSFISKQKISRLVTCNLWLQKKDVPLS